MIATVFGAPAAARGSVEADVAIIGAGLSGLMAASLLENAGTRIVVLEGDERIGGRAYTLSDLPGKPEAGGIQIGSNYTRLIALAKRCGIALVLGGEFDRAALYNIRGETLTDAQWPTADANLLTGPERAVPPLTLGPFYARRMPHLADIEACEVMRAVRSISPMTPRSRRRARATRRSG